MSTSPVDAQYWNCEWGRRRRRRLNVSIEVAILPCAPSPVLGVGRPSIVIWRLTSEASASSDELLSEAIRELLSKLLSVWGGAGPKSPPVYLVASGAPKGIRTRATALKGRRAGLLSLSCTDGPDLRRGRARTNRHNEGWPSRAAGRAPSPRCRPTAGRRAARSLRPQRPSHEVGRSQPPYPCHRGSARHSG